MIRSSGINTHIQVYFYAPPNTVRVFCPGPGGATVDQVRISLIFLSDSLASNGTYLFPYNKYIFTASITYSESVNTLASWIETSNIICGLYKVIITGSQYDYSISQDGTVILTTGFSGYMPAWGRVYCFVAATKRCPTNYPYYNYTSQLC